MLQTLRPLLTVTAATLGSLTFTSLIDCDPSLFLWDRWHDSFSNGGRRVSDFYKGKTIWIIGASSGIGEELAYQLARVGCSNLILSSRSEKALDDVATKCGQESSLQCQCYCRPLDVVGPDGGDVSQLEELFDDMVQNRLPPLPVDIVIYNAGAGQLRPALDTPAKIVQKVMDVNALWPMILTPLLFKHDVFHQSSPSSSASSSTITPTSAQRRAHIVVTNSIAALLPVPLSSVYAASKAAQAHYFSSLVAEQPDNRLRVDVICPGPVETPFHQNNPQLATTTTRGLSASVDNPAQRDAKGGTSAASSGTKMPVERCAHLMISAMARDTKEPYQEVWIARPPFISVLFLQRLFPGLLQKLTTKFGQKRVQLWKEGKDLYDPKSWK